MVVFVVGFACFGVSVASASVCLVGGVLLADVGLFCFAFSADCGLTDGLSVILRVQVGRVV